MSVTIRDVAKLAGVAPSTVSRVIAGSNRISQATKERVYEAMEKLGYHPNYNARSLAVKSTRSIGIIMPRSTEQAFLNPFFPEVLRGISVRANEKGYALFLSTGKNEEEQKQAVMDMVQGRRVDGVIVLYSRFDDPVVDYLMNKNFPFVMVGKPAHHASKISYVDNDNILAGKEITQHLIDLGHQRIGFVGGSRQFVVTMDRLAGYQEALSEAGIAYDAQLLIEQDFLPEGGYQGMKQLMQVENPPTALVVVDDMMALGVISALDELGLSVPEDVSVASINDFYISRVSTPALTTVNINIFRLGYQATDKLLYWLENEEADLSPTIVGHELRIRHSTAPVAALNKD
ncbi:LacI family transcriptional regulator [Caldalkalibacillus thermarum]|uniref:LacI family DNA-binding transcriptional regulator n=1 Tax=Caldalkalibacillus thermarum TaxID=296745 RepID=UPI001663E195|nr:LacI family DNA-binding transcriptional regulator [Caldalkalibacillus thermarum]GGK11824.1 LacI family transcriptional regulator [Caldalkalibacillus thermarum]